MTARYIVEPGDYGRWLIIDEQRGELVMSCAYEAEATKHAGTLNAAYAAFRTATADWHDAGRPILEWPR